MAKRLVAVTNIKLDSDNTFPAGDLDVEAFKAATTDEQRKELLENGAIAIVDDEQQATEPSGPVATPSPIVNDTSAPVVGSTDPATGPSATDTTTNPVGPGTENPEGSDTDNPATDNPDDPNA